ncbi:MAG: hypothetical protein PHR81_12330 [Bacteroidales bacterium]|nr:hypothetical protein [Bacteroidales bacterium]MDD4215588.1 hypothetical protein [Bacteroidales bacterium]
MLVLPQNVGAGARNEPNMPDLAVTAGREKDGPDDASARSQKILKI